MKSLTLRSSFALALALSLAGCGGGGNLLLGGQVYGLDRGTLVLKNKGGPALPITVNGAFSFPELLGSDQDFEITVADKPASAFCEVINGKGRTGSVSVTNVQVVCTTYTHKLGGTITGPYNGVVLVNGPDQLLVPANLTKFEMSKVADGKNYGVTVLTQPKDHTCTVENGTGTMADKDLDNIKVTCV